MEATGWMQGAFCVLRFSQSNHRAFHSEEVEYPQQASQSTGLNLTELHPLAGDQNKDKQELKMAAVKACESITREDTKPLLMSLG